MDPCRNCRTGINRQADDYLTSEVLSWILTLISRAKAVINHFWPLQEPSLDSIVVQTTPAFHHQNKKAKSAVAHPSATRPSYRKDPPLPSPPHERFGFIGTEPLQSMNEPKSLTLTRGKRK